ncbi:MAG: hypothetical protein ACRDD2_06710 [Sarcina sp.]
MKYIKYTTKIIMKKLDIAIFSLLAICYAIAIYKMNKTNKNLGVIFFGGPLENSFSEKLLYLIFVSIITFIIGNLFLRYFSRGNANRIIQFKSEKNLFYSLILSLMFVIAILIAIFYLIINGVNGVETGFYEIYINLIFFSYFRIMIIACIYLILLILFKNNNIAIAITVLYQYFSLEMAFMNLKGFKYLFLSTTQGANYISANGYNMIFSYFHLVLFFIIVLVGLRVVFKRNFYELFTSGGF